MPTKLGQNFLRDKAILDRVIQSANLNAADFVLEVGPGEGVLTEELARVAKKVIAIEIDKNLVPKLKSRFHGNAKVEIINADILKINLPELIEKKMSQQGVSMNINSYKVIANIPYYITSPIIRLFLETKYPPTELILMIQKEVAERICAKPGKMSVLALSVQYYAGAKLLFTVPAEAFLPVPEVDSAVIHIALNKNRENKESVKKFFRIVNAGFSAKRKTLINNLSSSLKLEKNIVAEKLKQVSISTTQRAQELNLEDWKRLAELL